MIKFKPLKELKEDDKACLTCLTGLAFNRTFITWAIYYCCPIFEMLGDGAGKLISAFAQTGGWCN